MSTRTDLAYNTLREALFNMGAQESIAIAEVAASDADETVTVLLGAGNQNLILSMSYGDLDAHDYADTAALWQQRIEAAQTEDKPETTDDPKPARPAKRTR